MNNEIEAFKKAYGVLMDHTPEGPEFKDLDVLTVVTRPASRSPRSWRMAIAAAALAVVGVGALPLILSMTEPDVAGQDVPPFATLPGFGEVTPMVWMSQTPGEFIIEIGSTALVGSTTDHGVAPFDDPNHPMLEQATDGLMRITGASVTPEAWVAISVYLRDPDLDQVVVSLMEQDTNFEATGEILDSLVVNPTSDVVVGAIFVGEEADEPGPLLLLEAKDDFGSVVGSLYVRPLPLDQFNCGAAVATTSAAEGRVVPTTAPPEMTTTTISPEGSRELPTAVLPLRIACPEDIPRPG